MDIEVAGEVIEWRGPAPYHFVVLPDDAASAVESVASRLTYGWGVIPVRGRVGGSGSGSGTEFTTSLFPRAGGYWLPLKDAVRRAEGIELGDVVQVVLTLDV